MTALLTAESRGSTGPAKNEKIAQAIAECKRLYLTVLSPDINKSGKDFTIEDNKYIRFGLSAIKNVGDAAIKNILVCKSIGDFKSFEDFCERVDLSTINKKTIESLIKSGAMDTFNKNRAQLLTTYQDIVDNINQKKKQTSAGQASLFGDSEEKSQSPHQSNSIDDFSPNEKLAFEKEFLGFYLTSHPQQENLFKLQSMVTHSLESIEEEKEGGVIKTGGIIESIKKIFTKKTGAEMAFLTIGDEKGITIECIVFPKIYEVYKNYIIKDSLIVVDGKLDTKNDRPIIIVEKISTL
jgi:DNA polymerase III subunit alpha